MSLAGYACQGFPALFAAHFSPASALPLPAAIFGLGAGIKLVCIPILLFPTHCLICVRHHFFTI